MDDQSMQPNTPLVASLFNLVRSLTPSQKRDFKKDAKFWADRTTSANTSNCSMW